jgi:hypothetical protein
LAGFHECGLALRHIEPPHTAELELRLLCLEL